MRRLHVRTSYGDVVFLVSQVEGPTVVMIPGLTRSSRNLLEWRDHLPEFAVSFAELPGHNGAPPLNKTDILQWTAAFNDALPYAFPRREIFIVGESLGGLLAMGLAAKHIIAVDPFLDAPQFIQDRVRVPMIPPGLQRITLQPHHAVLDRIKSPTLVLGGKGETQDPDRMPSALTDQDFARFAEHPLVTCERVEGGHLLLTQSQEAMIPVIRRTFRQVPA